MIIKWIAVLWLTLAGNLTTRDSDTIEWSASRRLVWGDFTGKPDASAINAALTSSGLEFGYSYKDQQFNFTIRCLFDKNKSWGKIKTDYILSHEQGHFDISEIHARKLYKTLKAYSFNKATAAKDLSAIYQELLQEQTDMQNQYDDETNYSRNKEQQAAWLKKINTALEKLKDYADYPSK